MSKYEPLTGADSESCPACIGISTTSHLSDCPNGHAENASKRTVQLLDELTVEQMEASRKC